MMLRDKLGEWLSHFGQRLDPRHVIAHPSRSWPGLAAALVLGALPALAFPAPSWWWLAWFDIVPLLLVVRAAPTARAAAALRAWCGMAGYILATQYWLLPSAGPLLIVLAIGLGALWLPWGLAAYLLLSDPITARGTAHGHGGVAECLGDGRSGAILAEPGRSMGNAWRVAVEPAGHAGLGLARRRVAHQFRDRRSEHRDRRCDPSSARVRPRHRRIGGTGMCGTRPGMVLAGTGASGRVDGTGGARSAGQSSRTPSPVRRLARR